MNTDTARRFWLAAAALTLLAAVVIAQDAGKFTDTRDGKTYKKVTIGKQVWMAENLNCDVTGSKCYGDDPANCNRYGRLYNWSTAMNGSSSSSSNPSGVRGVCPTGWHLPSDAEWTALKNAVDGSSTAGRELKAKEGWYDCGPEGSGKTYRCNDKYGFSALPGGYGRSGGDFGNAGNYGLWWSATEDTADYAWGRGMDYDSKVVYRYSGSKTSLFSVRCVQD